MTGVAASGAGLLPRGRELGVLALTGATLGAVAVLRFAWIENTALGFACAAEPGFWCAVRETVVLGFHYRVYGWLAVALGLLGLLRPHAGWAAATLVVASVALWLYNTDLGAVAFVLGLITLARRGGREGREG